MQALLAAQAGGGFRIDQALLACLRAQLFRIDAGAIVLHLDADVVTFLLRRQPHMAHPRLALRFAQVGHFHAMVDGVADQVHQRVGQRFDQVAVELGLGADQLQVHFLLQRAGDVAGDLGEAREYLAHRLHAGAHHRRLQARGGDVQGGHGAVQLLVAQARTQGLEPVARQHQFADQVDDRIQALGVHAHGVLGLGQRLGGRLGGRCRCGRRARGCHRRRCHGGSRLGTWRGATVQLVPQGFELVFADQSVVGFFCRRDGGRCIAAVKLVEQGLELVVGDQVAAARGGRCCGGGSSHGTTVHVELGDQIRRRIARLGAGRHRVQHRLQVVQ